MKTYLLLTLMIGSVSLFGSGCSSNTANGAAIGSLVGAGIGKSTANHKDKRAAIGAVVGGAVGAAIGAESDRAANNGAQSTNYHTYNNPPVSHTYQQPYPYAYYSNGRSYDDRRYKKRHPRKNRYRDHHRHDY